MPIFKRIENEKSQFQGGWFFKKEEIGRSWDEVYKYVCDVCGKQEEFRGNALLGLYVGMIRTRHFARGFIESTFGYKRKPIVFCDIHTEKEIEKTVEELKKKEARAA